MRPSPSAPGESSGTTIPFGVRRSVHRQKRTALVHLATGFTDQLCPALQQHHGSICPKVSVAVMQVVMPGKVESIADSSAQSMKHPWPSRKRRVGSNFACAASSASIATEAQWRLRAHWSREPWPCRSVRRACWSFPHRDRPEVQQPVLREGCCSVQSGVTGKGRTGHNRSSVSCSVLSGAEHAPRRSDSRSCLSQAVRPSEAAAMAQR